MPARTKPANTAVQDLADLPENPPPEPLAAKQLVTAGIEVDLERDETRPSPISTQLPRTAAGLSQPERPFSVGELGDAKTDSPPMLGPIASRLDRPRAGVPSSTGEGDADVDLDARAPGQLGQDVEVAAERTSTSTSW